MMLRPKATPGVVIVALSVLAGGAWLLFAQHDDASPAIGAAELLATGKSQFQAKEYDAAIETLAAVPVGSDQEQRALYYRGSAFMMLEDFEAAISHFEQSLALNNRDTGVLYGLGVAYYKLGELKLARGYFAAVLEINPNDADAKGLMDIMANLERLNEPGQAEDE